MSLEVIKMCIRYLNEELTEEKINELIKGGACYYNETPDRYTGTVKQVDFYVDYSKNIPISMIHIECMDFLGELKKHPLVIYLDPLNQYSQKILNNLEITFDQPLVPQFKRLIDNQLRFEVVWFDEKQSFISNAQLMKPDNSFINQVVVHLGKLDEPVILDEVDCDLLDFNSKINQLRPTRLEDYVEDWDELDESYYSKVIKEFF